MPTSESSPKRQRMQSAFAPAVDELHAFKRTWPNWCTIESEPVIWNQLLRDIGAHNTQVQEVYCIDEEGFAAVNPAHGIIFCMVFNTKYDPSEQEVVCPDGLWFANQVEDNACGTYAIMNIIMNSPDVELSSELISFKEYSKTLTPPHKGLAVASFEFLKSAHNSFGLKSEMDDWDLGQLDTYKASKKKPKAESKKKGKKKAKVEEEEEEDIVEEDMAYHYIAYIHFDGAIWELDGLKRQPVKFKTCIHEDWLKSIGPRLHERIALYPESLMRFSCLALIPERLPIYRTELASNAALIGAVEAQLQAVNPKWRDFITGEPSDGLYIVTPTDSAVEESEEVIEIKSLINTEFLIDRRSKLCIEQADLKHKIFEEEKEAAEEAVVVERTRHDYEPFIREMSRILARDKKARDIYDPQWAVKAARKRAALMKRRLGTRARKTAKGKK